MKLKNVCIGLLILALVYIYVLKNTSMMTPCDPANTTSTGYQCYTDDTKKFVNRSEGSSSCSTCKGVWAK